MRIIKALNNNMILVRQPNGQELICQGKGIGWHKRSGDEVDETLIEQRFLPENEAESRHFQQLFSEIEDAYWGIAEELLDYARSRYALKVSERVILPLCDHQAGRPVSGRHRQRGVQPLQGIQQAGQVRRQQQQGRRPCQG